MEEKMDKNKDLVGEQEERAAMEEDRVGMLEEEEEEEEEEDEDYGEEEEEEEGEEGENEMDPLDYVDEEFRVGTYQQLSSLEYEVLAEKKRRALHEQQRDESSKKPREDDIFGAKFDEILEAMTHHRGRKSGQPKKRGRRKGSKNKLSPEVTRKLGDATLLYASGNYNEAISLLKEVVRMAPNLPEAHHTLGLIYNAIGDRKKAMNFYMVAAHLTPKDPSLWKLLVAWSIEQGNTGQIRYCLSKAITADPENISLRLDRALLHIELGDYLKAAECYHQIIGLCPTNIEACKMAAKMYQRCGQVEKAIQILENYLSEFFSENDLSVVNFLMSLYMDNNLHAKALEVFQHFHSLYYSQKEFPLHLTVKAGVCQAYLGNMEKAEDLFQRLWKEPIEDNGDLVIEIADSFSNLGHYESALKYYFMLEETSYDKGPLQLKISECYLSLKKTAEAISLYYKALSTMEGNIDARIMLSTILVQEERIDEAITLLAPLKDSESTSVDHSMELKPWWLDGRVKMQLARIYHGKGMLEEFVETIFSSVHETLLIETLNEKVPVKKRLTIVDLSKRAKLLDDQADNVFRGFKPIATPSELVKASRAKKKLQKWTALREERKAKALASGLEWQNDDLDEESLDLVDHMKPKELQEPPLPKLLKDEKHYHLILDLCKALVSLRRYWEALEVINLVLKSACKFMPEEKKEELRSLRAQIAYNASDPKHGYEFVRSIVLRHPNSYAAWNCYYTVISRLDYRLPKHAKFIQQCGKSMQNCVPPMIIHGHQFTMNSQHQDAARKYLQAYKLQPDNPLINLCAGTALINLALGFRLKNKHLTLIQGFGFLYEYLHLCNKSQEALYNVARACQHVGLVTLSASYYEKVLEMKEKDYPIPKLPNEAETKNSCSCDLRREAAYNLHLIYKKSGAVDLARHILKVYCCI